MENRYCGNCFNNKPLDNFSLESPSNPKKGYRRICKPCVSEIEARRIAERKLDMFPSSFWECDNCDHITSIKKEKCNKCKEGRYNGPGHSSLF
jgi:hypothetical protein